MATLGCISLSHWTVWNAYFDRAIVLHAQFVDDLEDRYSVPDEAAWTETTRTLYSQYCEMVAAFAVFQAEAHGHYVEHDALWNSRPAEWRSSASGDAVRNWLDDLWEIANAPYDEPELSLRVLKTLTPSFPATVTFEGAFDLDSFDSLLEDAGFFKRDSQSDRWLVEVMREH